MGVSMEAKELLERRSKVKLEGDHVNGQSRLLINEICERLSIGHINKMEGIVAWNNDRLQLERNELGTKIFNNEEKNL